MLWRYRIGKTRNLINQIICRHTQGEVRDGDRDYRRRLSRRVQELLALPRRVDSVPSLRTLSNAVNLREREG